MSRLLEAAERLIAATEQLEKAASARSGEADGEHAQLKAALDRAQRENEALAEATNLVSGRLDRAIERIQDLLER